MAQVVGERVSMEDVDRDESERMSERAAGADPDDSTEQPVEASDVLLQSEILQPDRINEFQVQRC